MLCEIFDISRSGYYKYLRSFSNPKKLKSSQLLKMISLIYDESKGNYEASRIYQEPRHRGMMCNHKTVEKLMVTNKIRASRKKKFRTTTDSRHGFEINRNLLNRQFNPTEPNKVWCSDITYIRTEEGWLYLCVFIDLFSRKIIGWSCETHMKAAMVIKALKMAIYQQNGKICSILHSDRGVQYACNDFRTVLSLYKTAASAA